MRQLVHAQSMIVVVVLYRKLVGVPVARQALLAKGRFHIDIWRRGVNNLKVVFAYDTRISTGNLREVWCQGTSSCREDCRS